MANATWNSTITSAIFLAASPPPRASFGTVLLLVDQDDGNGLNGARVMSFASYTEALAANDANYISDDTLEALRVGFNQSPAPAVIKVGNQSTSGTVETLTTAIAAIQVADDDWFGLCIYSRVAADIAEVAGVIETGGKKLFIAQSADADWKTSGLPTGLTTLAEKERTAVIFHDADTAYADIAWAVSRLVFDPDVQSAGWSGQIREVAALTTDLTSAQRDFIEGNNANVGLPFSSADVYVDPGINCNGRPLYQIVTADWFDTRCHEDLAAMKLGLTAIGSKLPVDSRGQGKCIAIFRQRLQQGEDAGHFKPKQTRATALDITEQDLADRKMRFKVEAVSAEDGRLLDFSTYVSTDDLQAP